MPEQHPSEPKHHAFSESQLSQRSREIQPFHVMDLLGKAKRLEQLGHSIIHLEVGEPDFNTPETIQQAALKALSDKDMHYTASLGLPELRQALAGFYQQQFAVDIAAERVVITPGASGALLLLLGALINPGEGVMMADPGYPCNRNFNRFVEGRTIAVNVDHHSNFQLTAELIEQSWQPYCKAVLIASPSNPTGTLIAKDEMRRIIEVVRAKGGVLIVDEIYQGLVYEAENFTALSLADDVFVINSFSKYFHMTGWRLGWCVVPEAAIDSLDKLSQNLYLAAPTPAQYAALAAFSDETLAILETRRQAFKARRDYLYPALKRLGFVIDAKPQGAFYLYADVSHLTHDSWHFANQLLEKGGVAITPGKDFGHHQPERFVRIAYTRDIEQLQEAVTRIEQFLSERDAS